MDHYSNTVQYYLHKTISCDIQAAFLNRPSNEMIHRVARRLALTADAQAPTTPSVQQMLKIEQNPQLQSLKARSEQLTKQLRAVFGTVKNAHGEAALEKKRVDADRQCLRMKLIQQATKRNRKRHFRTADTRELDRQATESFVNSTTDTPSACPHYNIKERGIIVQLLRESRRAGEMSIRLDLIRARARLCTRQERQVRGPRARREHDAVKTEASDDAIEDGDFPLECQPSQCLFCLGNRRKSYRERVFAYKRVNHMLNHIEKHKRYPRDEIDSTPCPHPLCRGSGVSLRGAEAFKAHVKKVHRISLRRTSY